MCTKHTVVDGSGKAHKVSVRHSRVSAVQYDFYVPSAIWDLPPIQTFLERLLSIEPGATIFSGLLGVWQGETEDTRIYRLILRNDQYQRNNVIAALKSEIGGLLSDLSITPNAQDAFMYTETEIQMNISES